VGIRRSHAIPVKRRMMSAESGMSPVPERSVHASSNHLINPQDKTFPKTEASRVMC